MIEISGHMPILAAAGSRAGARCRFERLKASIYLVLASRPKPALGVRAA
jgi:hypothetical protein